jgi:hydroxyacylglutathione hydrolase
MEKGAIAIDTNMPTAFGGAHVKGTYSIWLDGLPNFAGWVLPYDRPILLVLENQTHLTTAITYLIRLGYEHIAGYLQGGIVNWYVKGLPIESLPLMSAQALKEKMDRREELTVLDVRGQQEWNSGHILGAQHIYVGHLEKEITLVDRSKPVAVVCTVGNRASLAASVLLHAGYQAYNVLGGMKSWTASAFPITRESTQGRVNHAR